MGAQIGDLWGFADHTQKMCPRSLRDVRLLKRVHLYSQTAVDAGDIHT